MAETSESDSFAEDEDIGQFQKPALPVQMPPRIIDENTVPADGHEYIYKSRLEDATLKFSTIDLNESTVSNKDQIKVDYNKWVGTRFYPLAKLIKNNKNMLRSKFKNTDLIPLENEEDCCTFCLGSEISSIIYANVKSQPTKLCHVPLLSYVIRLENSDITLLLTYLQKWFNVVRFKEEICLWMFALLFCLTKPLSDDDEDTLEDVYDDIKKLMKDCDKNELQRLQLFSSILTQGFCIKAYTVSPHNNIYTL